MNEVKTRTEADIFQEQLRNAALGAMLGVGKAFDAQEPEISEVFVGIMDRLYEFGTVRNFPPAEAFCRQFCEWTGLAFDAARWREDVAVRAPWEVYRAAVQALSQLKLPEAPPKPHRETVADGRGFERSIGMHDREHIGGTPKVAVTPLTDVKGIGTATAAKLGRAGITDDVAALAALPGEGLVEHLAETCPSPEACEEAAEVIIKNDLIAKAKAHLDGLPTKA